MAAPRAGGGGILETGMSGALIGSGDAVVAFMLDQLGFREGEDETRPYAVLRRGRRLPSSLPVAHVKES